MKNYLWGFLVMMLLIGSCFGQTEIGGDIQWKSLSPGQEEFSVEVPADLKYARADEKINSEGRGHIKIGNTYLYVFSDPAKNGDQYKVVDRFVNAHEVRPIEYELAGRIASKYEFEDSDGYFHKVVTTRTARRVYSFHAVSEERTDPMAERFIGSIQLSPVLSLTLNDSAGIELPRAMMPVPVQVGVVAGSTNKPTQSDETGSGRGSPAGSSADKQSNNLLSEKAERSENDSPFRLLSTTKAQYTDFARFYSISGTVVVRVFFKADGTIGDVIPITKLPFGLVSTSITAARKMKFEPLRINGVPHTTSRPVSYTFNIY